MTAAGWVTTSASLALAVVAIVIAVVLYRRQTRLVLAYAVRAVEVRKPAGIQNLQMMFRGQPVESLWVTTYALFNLGHRTVKASDIASGNPVRIEATSGFIIYETTQEYRTDQRGISVNPNANGTSASINFEYLDRGDGMVIKVIHGGQVELRGAVVGGQIRSFGEEVPSFWGALAVGFWITVLAVLGYSLPTNFGIEALAIRLPLLVAGFIVALTSVWVLYELTGYNLVREYARRLARRSTA